MPSHLINNFPRINAEMDAAIDRVLLRKGEAMKFRIIGELHSPKSGRVYRRGGGALIQGRSDARSHGRLQTVRTHQASAPGEPMATDTEELERSISVSPVERTGSIKQVSISSDRVQAFNEFGQRNVAPRPTWTPVGEQMSREVADDLATEIRSIR